MPDSNLPEQWKDSVRDNIRLGAELNTGFIFMNILAAIIASYGLLANSPAVIIGAMIVAMLLGPITGVSLALVDGDNKLLKGSLLTLVMGTLVVLGTAFIIGLVHIRIPITPEIMSRTSPNLIDLMVALAGGAAGAYASVSPRLSTAVVGVAIATALVPPLSSASILFAHGQPGLAMGAFFLAFTNMVAIQLVSSVVLWANGFRKASHAYKDSIFIFIKQNAISLALLLAMASILTASLHRAVGQDLFESATQTTLAKVINKITGTYLSEVVFEKESNNSMEVTTVVNAFVQGAQPPTGGQVAAVEAQLPKPEDGSQLELRTRFLETTLINRDGIMYEQMKLDSSGGIKGAINP